MNNMQKEIILNAPGMVGQVAQYINEVSYKEQPVLAMAGAIAFTGAIYGHRLRTPGDLRTNMCVFSLAETGSGKDAPQKAIKKLLEYLPAEFAKLDCGRPASAPGLLSALNKADGVGLFLIDEIGHYINTINGKNAASHTNGIMGLLTELFTSASITYRGMEYSDRSKDNKPRVDIVQPCACVLGSSVPERVYGAIKFDDIADGFLPRWLIFESSDIAPKNNPAQRQFEESSGVELADKIKELTYIIKDKMTHDGISIRPLIVKPDAAASKLLEAFNEKMEVARQVASFTHDNMKYVYSRAYEHAEKLALIGCEFVGGEFIITGASAKWAIEIVKYSIDKMESVVEKLAKSPYEQELDDMLERIKRYDKLSRSQFGNLCRKWRVRERNDMLNNLVDCGKVVKFKIKEVEYLAYYEGQNV